MTIENKIVDAICAPATKTGEAFDAVSGITTRNPIKAVVAVPVAIVAMPFKIIGSFFGK